MTGSVVTRVIKHQSPGMGSYALEFAMPRLPGYGVALAAVTFAGAFIAYNLMRLTARQANPKKPGFAKKRGDDSYSCSR